MHTGRNKLKVHVLDERRGAGGTVKIGALLLTACMCGAATAQPAVTGCPDLSGTYEVRLAAWGEKFSPFGRRPRMQTRQLATFQPREGGFTLIWHTSREEVLSAARALSQRDPGRYGSWLDRVLRDPKLPLPLGVASEHDWINRMSHLGPILRGVEEVLPARQCKDGWLLVNGPGRRDGPPDFEGGMEGTRELEIWLGRDKDGSLSLKVEEHRTFELARPYKGYREISIRRGSSARLLEKWPVAPAQDLTPLRAEELPEGKRPSRMVPKCQITGDHETLFIHRLKARLPPKVEIDGMSASIASGRVRPDGTCNPTPFSLIVHAPDAASVSQVAEYLRTDPFIRQLDSQASQALWDGRLRVTFRMMAAPP